MKTFYDINGLDLAQVTAALRSGYANAEPITKKARTEVLQRLRHLEDRKRRLESTVKLEARNGK